MHTKKSKLYRKQYKVPFHNSELSVDMLGELMDLFTPQSGLVIDTLEG